MPLDPLSISMYRAVKVVAARITGGRTGTLVKLPPTDRNDLCTVEDGVR